VFCLGQVFDSTGQFIRQFTLPPRSQQTAVSAPSGANASAGACQTVRPYGLCVSSAGCVYVCDRDGHRILVFTSDGQLVGDLFQSADAASSQPAVKYPCDVAVTQSVDNAGTASTLVAVAESCSGLLDAERHHAVKLYAYWCWSHNPLCS
jgi:DNA-binding beta-propeller fold protein YncE